MMVYADDYKEVPSVQSGSIVAVTGLKVCKIANYMLYNVYNYLIKLHYNISFIFVIFKSTVCGDLLSSTNNAVKNALAQLSKSKQMTEDESIEALGVDMHVPDPVFFCSIEPPSQVN